MLRSMVDWDRVEELRSKGWDWKAIAADPKVQFHPDASAGEPGRALRALYHRSGRRERHAVEENRRPRRLSKEETERRWTLTRVGYLAVPLVGVWFGLAFVAPSPVGLLVPAIPYLALGLAAVAFVLIYALWRRTEGRRWTTVYRTTVIGGVVLGLVVSGGIGLAYSLIFGCPYLPPASSLTADGGSGWSTGPLPSWTSGGSPVVFFYGATWCPYCSASSWAIYKALSGYGTVSNTPLNHSSLSDIYKGTPEIVLANAQLSSKNGHGPAVAFEAAEDTSGTEGNLPGTASCVQQAYVSAYATGIPFLVIGGTWVHQGTLIDPAGLGPWAYPNMSTNGPSQVKTSVDTESAVTGGNPWLVIQNQAWWIMAYIAKDLGYTSTSVSTLSGEYGWSSTTLSNVQSDLRSLGS